MESSSICSLVRRGPRRLLVVCALACTTPRPASPARPAPSEPAAVSSTPANDLPAPSGSSDVAAVPASGDPCSSQPEAPGTPLPVPDAGYDRWLDGYPYPFEVRRMPLEVQGRALCLAYMDAMPAQPNGHVALLLHGKNFSGAYWRATAEALLASGYRVVMPDQIGFGKSSKPTDIQYSFALLAQNTSRLLDVLGIARASVVGHSMGGMLAVRWATQYPDRTDHLVLLNPIGLEDYRRAVPYLGVDAWQQQVARQTPESIRGYMRSNYFHDSWQPAYESLLDLQLGWSRGPDRQLLARVSALTQDMIYTQPIVYDLPFVRVPTLLVIGRADRTALGKGDVEPAAAARLGDYPALGERAARAIPQAELLRLAGVGHLPQFEAFDRWREALLSFLPAGARGSSAPAATSADAP